MMECSEELRVRVLPYLQQPDGDEIVIGHPERAVFLAIPRDAAEVLDWLSRGLSPADASALYRSRTGEDLDLDGFLDVLEARGFIQRVLNMPSNEEERPSRSQALAVKPPHFAWIPEKVACAFFAPGTVIIYLGVIVAALGVAATHLYLIPSWRSLAFQNHFFAAALLGLLLNLLATFLHEMGHLLAARARSTGARIGVGNRLWMVVVETDMTGLWALPSKERYLPFLAGILVDAVSASVLILLLFVSNLRAIGPPISLVQRIASAMLFGYFLRLVWQCYLFVRTDLYYVIANLFHCKNLLGDTETLLKNLVSHALPSVQRQDQSHIPRREMRCIRIYAVIWILGRFLAVSVLVTAQLPLLIYYLTAIFRRLAGDRGADLAAYGDSVTLSMASLAIAVLGFGLWFRAIVSRRRVPHGL